MCVEMSYAIEQEENHLWTGTGKSYEISVTPSRSQTADIDTLMGERNIIKIQGSNYKYK